MNRFSLSTLFALAGASLACGPAEYCLAEPKAEALTVLRGTTQSWLVSEFTGPIGCSTIMIDSILPKMETHKVSGDVVLTSIDMSVRRIYWDYFMVKMDSASAEKCRYTTRQRDIAFLPDLTYTNSICIDSLGAWCGKRQSEIDTLYSCHAGTCTLVPMKTVLANHEQGCAVRAFAPFPTYDSAFSFLKGRFEAANTRELLFKSDVIEDRVDANTTSLAPLPSVICLVDSQVVTVAGRTQRVDVSDDPRIQFDNPEFYPLGTFGPWAAETIPGNLAYPTPASIGDTYRDDTIRYSVFNLTNNPGLGTTFRSYATGKRSYQYRASSNQWTSCDKSAVSPVRLNDTLLLTGTPLLVTNANGDECNQREVDLQAGRFTNWLVLRADTTTPFQTAFRHTSSPENDVSWPIVNDTILVRNQKVPLAALLQGLTSARPSAPRTTFRVSVQGRGLAVELPEAATFEIRSPMGRILSRQELSSGRSFVALPSGSRGILIARAGGRTLRVLVP